MVKKINIKKSKNTTSIIAIIAIVLIGVIVTAYIINLNATTDINPDFKTTNYSSPAYKAVYGTNYGKNSWKLADELDYVYLGILTQFTGIDNDIISFNIRSNYVINNELILKLGQNDALIITYKDLGDFLTDNTWHKIELYVDIDGDLISVYVDGVKRDMFRFMSLKPTDINFMILQTTLNTITETYIELLNIIPITT